MALNMAHDTTVGEPRLRPDPVRVAELGEVFTPTSLVRDILDLVPAGELDNVEATCLDPACGHGQFSTRSAAQEAQGRHLHRDDT